MGRDAQILHRRLLVARLQRAGPGWRQRLHFRDVVRGDRTRGFLQSLFIDFRLLALRLDVDGAHFVLVVRVNQEFEEIRFHTICQFVIRKRLLEREIAFQSQVGA